MQNRVLVLGAALVLGACQDISSPGPAPEVDFDPSVAAVADAEPIAGQYMVVFRADVADVPGMARRLTAAHGGTLRHVYLNAVRGFALSNISSRAAAALARNPLVAYVEQDQVVRAVTTQSGATWGLDRIDQRPLPLTGTFSYTATGAGVTAYIIDTGIDYAHAEFGGRATFGYDAFNDGRLGNDCNGHGTHVAGTVGGATYGVAKKVSLVAVRVLDCGGSGSWSGVVAGVDWVVANHVAGAPAASNMSLGGGASTTVDDAVRRMIADGVASAVAAGNGNMGGVAQDACKYSPARVAEAMTIGATTRTDAKTSWSNYGNCVDWFAPGSGITSAWIGSGTTETHTISGTSMATPHVAGVAALYLEGNKTATPQQVRDALYAATTKWVVTSSKTANNHLLFTAY